MSWLDDMKVALAAVTGLGNWLVEMDLFLNKSLRLRRSGIELLSI